MVSVSRSSPVVAKWVTITSVLMGQSPVETVPACPVQIGAHHHIDVKSDINKRKYFCVFSRCKPDMTLVGRGIHDNIFCSFGLEGKYYCVSHSN